MLSVQCSFLGDFWHFKMPRVSKPAWAHPFTVFKKADKIVYIRVAQRVGNFLQGQLRFQEHFAGCLMLYAFDHIGHGHPRVSAHDSIQLLCGHKHVRSDFFARDPSAKVFPDDPPGIFHSRIARRLFLFDFYKILQSIGFFDAPRQLKEDLDKGHPHHRAEAMLHFIRFNA